MRGYASPQSLNEKSPLHERSARPRKIKSKEKLCDLEEQWSKKLSLSSTTLHFLYLNYKIFLELKMPGPSFLVVQPLLLKIYGGTLRIFQTLFMQLIDDVC